MSTSVTPDIHLSPITMADARAITAYMQDHDVSRYTRLIPYPYQLEMAEHWIASIADDVTRHGRETIWAIRHASGLLIGAIELHAGDAGREHNRD